MRETMVKRRRSCSSMESSPQFFKVYLPDRSSHQLRIPPEFVKYLSGVSPCKSTITSPEKRSWQVGLDKFDGNVYFHEGWQQFVQDNSLEFGDFLVFSYGGNAKFDVRIYGENGCQKEVTAPTLPEENQAVEQRESNTSKEIIKKELCTRVPTEIQEDDGALEEASKLVSEFPFFKVVMMNTYVKHGIMNMPTRIVNSYMLKDGQSVTLIASDRSWPVKLIKNTGPAWRFSQGWVKFSKDNTLKAGDVCVFELIDRNDSVLKVSIFRRPD